MARYFLHKGVERGTRYIFNDMSLSTILGDRRLRYDFHNDIHLEGYSRVSSIQDNYFVLSEGSLSTFSVKILKELSESEYLEQIDVFKTVKELVL